MAVSSLVRASRDGDQFHYAWTARRCLKMLLPESDLVAVAVEGPSVEEGGDASAVIEAGEEIIDIAEYYGSEDLTVCARAEYVQLKHSTLRPDLPWTLSELCKTLKGFAARFIALRDQHSSEIIEKRVRFRIVTNRPFGAALKVSITACMNPDGVDILQGQQALLACTGLDQSDLSAFCNLLSLEGAQDDYIGQRQTLRLELNGYLAGDDADAPVRLKELVNGKALSNSAASNVIRVVDVLRALGTSLDEILPAPNTIENTHTQPREQEQEIAAAIVKGTGPLVIHASGGIGKSILATRLPALFPAGSISIIYDCFGNGSYRQAANPRHLPRQGLVQIANELASHGLCDPLIPSLHADRSQYFRAFAHRLKQCDESIRLRSESAIISIIVDAADNAEMIAEEFRDGNSFIRALLRQEVPASIRLIALSRTERLHLLDLPSSVRQLSLRSFSLAESTVHLRSRFPGATDADALEFHRLTSANPRVQAVVIAQENSTAAVLSSLGVNPISVDDTIALLLERAIAKLIDNAGKIEQKQIATLSTALATLRPFVPISVLSEVAGVDAAFVHSFAADLGRPLLVSGDAVQFRDEPTETWFRERFRPSADQFANFAINLEPLATKNAYAASALPQILLEAGQFDRLISLALSSDGLPSDSPAEKRDIEVQRLLFALRAALRDKQYMAASKLAMKAGQEVSGISRQENLLQDNLDLVALFLSPDRIRELVARHPFSGKWLGSRHLYEAALLVSVPDFLGDARSQMRMAEAWLRSWSDLSSEDRERETISDLDIAEMASVYWKLGGSEACAKTLARWTPKTVSFQTGVTLAGRALDRGLIPDVEALAMAGRDNLYLALGIILEFRRANLVPPKSVVDSSLAHLAVGDIKVLGSFSSYRIGSMESGLVALTESAILVGAGMHQTLADTLDPLLVDLTPYHFADHNRERRFLLLRALCLRARLRGQEITLETIASPKTKERLDKKQPYSDDREMREFREGVGALLPWHKLCVEQLFSPATDSELADKVHLVITQSQTARGHFVNECSRVSEDIAVMWCSILCTTESRNEPLVRELLDWAELDGNCIFIPTWVSMTRLAAASQTMTGEAYVFSKGARLLIDGSTLDAESKADSYISLARALLCLDRAEAASHFDAAITVASKLGDEVYERWGALLDLSNAAATGMHAGPEIAYRVARCAELAEEYGSKHFQWEETIRAINGLSPSSGLAILSRWQDRRFGWLDNTLKIGFEDLMRRGFIPPRIVVPLFSFRAAFDYVATLKHCLEEISEFAECEQIFSQAMRTIKLERHSLQSWIDLKEIASQFGFDSSFIEERIEFETGRQVQLDSELSRAHERKLRGRDEEALGDRLWKELYIDDRLYSADDLTSAFTSWRKAGKDAGEYLSTRDFIARAVTRAAVAKAVPFIQAFTESVCFDAWDASRFFEHIPSRWLERLSTTEALKQSARTLVAQFCADISKSRFNQPLPLSKIVAAAKMDEHELVTIALRALSDSPMLEDPSRLFSLVGLLAGEMSSDEAFEALDFGLELMETELTPTNGDGAWRQELCPPDAPSEALAGFIYAKLASPVADMRWQAAHVVKELCIAREIELIDHLISCYKDQGGGAFADPELHFYDLHARQWLLIALARAAMEHPSILSKHIHFFVQQALTEDHVLIRHFAGQTALTLVGHGTAVSQIDLDGLQVVNSSPFPIVESERYRRSSHPREDAFKERPGDHFIFGYDLDRYWFEPLASCFALNKGNVMAIADDVVRKTWGPALSGSWKDDIRTTRKIFRDRETWHSHSSYPRTDDLNFYLSYHAMMATAGKLLATNPVHREPGASETAFEVWLRSHVLTRSDGYWLADRRDCEPLGLTPWIGESQNKAWRWQIGRSDFEHHFGLYRDRMTVFGDWTTVVDSREENIHITSALATTPRAEALLRATQTTQDSHHFTLPQADSEEEINAPGFQLRGWLTSHSQECKLDELDLWAGSIRFSEPALSQPIMLGFKLIALAENRSWAQGNSGANVLWSQVWGYNRVRDNDEGDPASGVRLQISRTFLSELLHKEAMTLIVKVAIDRRVRRSRYDSDQGDSYDYVPPYFRIFLLKPDGQGSTV